MKDSFYKRKASFFNEKSVDYQVVRNFLLLVFYLFALLAIYIIIMKKSSIYSKVILILLIILFPFYIFYIEKFIYIIYKYFYGFTMGEVVTDTEL